MVCAKDVFRSMAKRSYHLVKLPDNYSNSSFSVCVKLPILKSGNECVLIKDSERLQNIRSNIRGCRVFALNSTNAPGIDGPLMTFDKDHVYSISVDDTKDFIVVRKWVEKFATIVKEQTNGIIDIIPLRNFTVNKHLLHAQMKVKHHAVAKLNFNR